MKNKDTPVIFSDYPDVLTVEDLSRMLGISTKTAYKLLKEQKIKSITIGRTYRIPKVYLLQYLQITEQIPHKYGDTCYNVLVMADEN